MDKNGVGNEHSNWDEQRERLSAYADGELPATEAQHMEAHLAGCESCRRELAELRQIRALLRALPAPRLSRSFTLPVTGPVPVAAAVARRERELRSRSPVVARAVQWMGGVAAAAGLALVLGSALAGFGGHSNASTARMPPASGAYHAPASPGATGPQGAAVGPHNTAESQSASKTPTAQPTETPAPSTAPQVTGANNSGLPIGPLGGAGLLVGGGVLLIGGRAAERRKRAG